MTYLVLLEKLTRKQLLIFLFCLLTVQIIYFLVGGFATKPAEASNHDFSICSTSRNNDWIDFGPKGNCKLTELTFESEKTWKDFVFVIQLPRITRWFQTLISLIVPHVESDSRVNLSSNATLTFDVRLGYKTDEMMADVNSQWLLETQSRESRSIKCQPIYHHGTRSKSIPDAYTCEPLPFFELSSLKYPYYLINLQIAGDNGLSQNIGKLKSLHFVGIHQDENFTKVWYILKTITFPIVLAALVWFRRQMKRAQKRYSNLDNNKYKDQKFFHELLYLLGLSACILNAPLDWLTLVIPFGGFQIYSEVRQGFFVTILVTFWLCFAGEHAGQDKGANAGFWSYGKYVVLPWFASSLLLIFELCQKGMQLWNPFYSLWSTRSGYNIGLTILVLAGASSFIYIICLIILVGRVFWNIHSKQTELAAMRRIRRLMYQGAFYRFQFLLLTTIFCAMITVISYYLSQIYETHWVWNAAQQPKFQYSGAFCTGIYGMSNIYVFALLILFSPTITNVDDMDELTSSADDGNTMHLTNNQTSAYQMISKAAIG